MTKSVPVDLTKLSCKVFIGRPNGRAAREYFKIDRLDPETAMIIFKVPENTISVNSSFFLGLFAQDILKIRDYDKFFEYVDISNLPPRFQNQLKSAVKRTLSQNDYGLSR